MSRSSAYERLKRSQRVPEPAPAEPAAFGLESLERQLLGAPAAELSLKERLERLAAAAARRPPVPPRARAAALEELVQGQRVSNEAGEFFLIESDQPLEGWHGQLPLTRFRTLEPDSVRLLTGELQLAGFDLPGAVFLDTETTGLAGGTGTAAFLIGVGFVEGERFRVRQYFMRDYHEEAALLLGLARDLERFRQVVTFNGKLFDLPLLETRYRLCRRRFPLLGAPHLDLLHPARRLWKARLESCRLQSLEAGLLGLRRQGDVPGELIPGLYFDYVRRGDGRALLKVFEHNRTDIVSLAALSVLACHWVAEDLAEHPLDCLSLGRVLERAAAPARASRAYRRALGSADGRVRVAALLRLATQARRAGRFEEALELWQAAAEAGEWRGFRELAVHHEHRTRRFEEALRWVERGLLRVSAGDAPRAAEGLDELEYRRKRLLRRQAALWHDPGERTRQGTAGAAREPS